MSESNARGIESPERQTVQTPTLLADGGVTWTDLTGFQRDCLEAIQRLEVADETISGQAIRRELRERYGTDINHGQLYPNLDNLVDAGFVEKGEIDKRTNSYHLTDLGRRMLEERVYQLADVCHLEVRSPATDGGEGA